MKKNVIIILWILIFCSQPCILYSQGIWKTLTREDGLAGDSVTCVNQDKLGNYWIGTWGSGLSKLDTNGVWTNFFEGDSLVFILDIEFDNFNNKWLVYAQQGGNYYSGKTLVVKFNDSTFTYYDPTWSPYYNPKPCCLGKDSLGNIWCGTTDFYAYWFDGKNWHEYGVWGCWGDLCTIRDIELDHNGNLYFGHNRGIASLGAYLRSVYRVYDIDIDRQNRLWFGSYDYDQPLGMFDGEKWHVYTLQDGLRHSWVMALAVDSTNNIWLSYMDGPVSKFDGQKFVHIDLPSALNGKEYRDMRYIHVDDKGDIWFASFNGVLILTDTTITKVNLEDYDDIAKPGFLLLQNYPNPFNSNTIIRYYLLKSSHVNLSIYNILGEEVISLTKNIQATGWYESIWNGTNKYGEEVKSGIYFAVLKCENFQKSIKLSFIR